MFCHKATLDKNLEVKTTELINRCWIKRGWQDFHNCYWLEKTHNWMEIGPWVFNAKSDSAHNYFPFYKATRTCTVLIYVWLQHTNCIVYVLHYLRCTTCMYTELKCLQIFWLTALYSAMVTNTVYDWWRVKFLLWWRRKLTWGALGFKMEV